jgi:hypothetical protein
MSELLDDPTVAATRVETSRAFLATAGGLQPDQIELRVAASITHLGLAARTLSPPLAAAVTSGHTAPTGLRDLHWQPTIGSMFPLSIAGLDDVPAEPQGTTTDPEAAAYTLVEGTIKTVAADLFAVFTRFGLSERLLLGNVASALNGAGTALSSASPEHVPRTRALVAALMHQPALAGTWQTSLDDRFQRRSCCLIYRAAPDRNGPLCGDCVLLGTRARTTT